jgi:hypothetical protein
MSTWTFGPVSVTRIEEQLGFASLPPERDALVTSVHSWFIRTAHHTILLDYCAGNHKDRPWLPRSAVSIPRLRAAGAVFSGDVIHHPLQVYAPH